MHKKFKAYYVPNFPIDKITNDGMDPWVYNPNHPKHRYKFLQGILEHIENTGLCEPIRLMIHNINDISAGPCGVARLYAFKHLKRATHIPAIVNSEELYDWFGSDVVEVTSEQEFYDYFLFKPHQVTFEENGSVIWFNQAPDPETARRTMKIKDIEFWIRGILDSKELAEIEKKENFRHNRRVFLL